MFYSYLFNVIFCVHLPAQRPDDTLGKLVLPFHHYLLVLGIELRLSALVASAFSARSSCRLHSR